MEDNKDQGLNVREKAKAMVALLKDDERLKNERTRALKAKERFAQSTQGESQGPAWPGLVSFSHVYRISSGSPRLTCWVSWR